MDISRLINPEFVSRGAFFGRSAYDSLKQELGREPKDYEIVSYATGAVDIMLATTFAVICQRFGLAEARLWLTSLSELIVKSVKKVTDIEFSIQILTKE